MGVMGFLVPSWPVVLGCDYAGEVVALGEGVTSPKVGDKVWGFVNLGHAAGTFSE